jgi:hypothetical protein
MSVASVRGAWTPARPHARIPRRVRGNCLSSAPYFLPTRLACSMKDHRRQPGNARARMSAFPTGAPSSDRAVSPATPGPSFTGASPAPCCLSPPVGALLPERLSCPKALPSIERSGPTGPEAHPVQRARASPSEFSGPKAPFQNRPDDVADRPHNPGSYTKSLELTEAVKCDTAQAILPHFRHNILHQALHSAMKSDSGLE